MDRRPSMDPPETGNDPPANVANHAAVAPSAVSRDPPADVVEIVEIPSDDDEEVKVVTVAAPAVAAAPIQQQQQQSPKEETKSNTGDALEKKEKDEKPEPPEEKETELKKKEDVPTETPPTASTETEGATTTNTTSETTDGKQQDPKASDAAITTTTTGTKTAADPPAVVVGQQVEEKEENAKDAPPSTSANGDTTSAETQENQDKSSNNNNQNSLSDAAVSTSEEQPPKDAEQKTSTQSPDAAVPVPVPATGNGDKPADDLDKTPSADDGPVQPVADDNKNKNNDNNKNETSGNTSTTSEPNIPAPATSQTSTSVPISSDKKEALDPPDKSSVPNVTETTTTSSPAGITTAAPVDSSSKEEKQPANNESSSSSKATVEQNQSPPANETTEKEEDVVMVDASNSTSQAAKTNEDEPNSKEGETKTSPPPQKQPETETAATNKDNVAKEAEFVVKPAEKTQQQQSTQQQSESSATPTTAPPVALPVAVAASNDSAEKTEATEAKEAAAAKSAEPMEIDADENTKESMSSQAQPVEESTPIASTAVEDSNSGDTNTPAAATTTTTDAVANNAVQEEDEEDAVFFPDAFPTRKRRQKAKRAKAQKKFKINIRSVTPPESPVKIENTSSQKADMAPSNVVSSGGHPDAISSEFNSMADDFSCPVDDDNNDYDRKRMDQELEDSLCFFQETHEEQDPSYIEFIVEREDKVLKKKLAQLEAEDAAGRKDIDVAIGEQSKEKQLLTNRNIEKYQQKAAQEEKRDIQRLMQLYNEKMNNNNARIQQGIKILTERHHKETQRKAQEHRARFQNQTQAPQAQHAWQMIQQQLHRKQHQQMAEFRQKGEEIKKKSENDFKAQQEKLRANYQHKLQEIEASKRKVYAKIYTGFQNLRQRYVKRHMQKITKKKELLIQQANEAKENLRRKCSPTPFATPSSSAAGKKRSSDPATSAHDAAKKKMEEKEELRSPSPIKSNLDWKKDEGLADQEEVSGGSARHKQRKSIFSQLSKQLSVEIHNEGLWISVYADKNATKDGEGGGNTEDASSRSNTTRNSDKAKNSGNKSGDGDKKNDKDKSTDVPRGYHYMDKSAPDFGDSLSAQGGHVRCVVTDLRTNENTASAQRAASIREQEDASLQQLEKKIVELSSLASEAETTLSRAENEEKEAKAAVDTGAAELEKAKQIQLDFRTKFANYLGPDGNPLPTANPGDRNELAKAIVRYKTNLEAAANRHKTATSNYGEARTRTQKMQQLAKHSQKAVAVATNVLKKKKATLEPRSKGRAKLSEAAENERAAGRVKDVIASLHKTAEKRREQLNQKRLNNASSTWVQALLPGIPGPLKKSLWHKMHRRRQQIVLRPSLESLTLDLRESVAKAMKATPSSKKQHVDLEEDQQRAEQLFCLAMYPVAPDPPLPAVPPSGSSSAAWAEPGWHLRLDAPKEEKTSHILPCAPSFPIFSKNLAEMTSTPGRQAAAFSRTSHLRSLASQLSSVATATSLAETNPSAPSEVSLAEGDPLNISPDAMMVGYSFHLPPPPKQTTAKRKSTTSASTVKENAAEVAAEAAAKSKQETTSLSSAAASKTTDQSASSAGATGAGAEKKKPETKRRRTSKTTAANPSPRARKGSKTDAATKRAAAAVQPPPPMARTPSSSYARQPTPAAAAAAPPATYARQPAPTAAAAAPSSTYARQPTPTAAAAAAAAAQYNQYMKHSPPQGQQAPPQQQPNYQLMQQQQQQQASRQAPQYGSPQQAHQLAQLRMMQQQQQQQQGQRAVGYPPQPGPPQRGASQAMAPQPFFNPMAPAPGGQPYQPMPMQGMQQMPPMGQPGMPHHLQQQHQQQQQQNRKPGY
ncbi:Catalyzes the transfer of the gamma-phosphate of ATP to D-galactose to form alpha-D-galactose-1-phosphate (Gal-1-P) (By similarity) [Seminavis robusta]|uniref:Catalyzes the transfer of the gamma-phosphate of ATP to D-galactose to form alpha-D-galactose-1-phosphate (Gal-1-P) By similarity n=1 Tax=Seminavis robusta TaxID=568900 RepID=A0A9N8DJI0_9STRA|nr:Catalyzes the transfer of the gamma-phosphate of ATP to D-galactose to form alpha-D-galactose-1-phosphate (Gal-1-P) (By similarity) [Seminavis robusta]|eukprot:Sro118_g057740.1 Catalyzes the transfer of the gamma-phosphate of ATP to D-galactose to form alpha-D-galactose-1-phosphate (Gal-1-P) (By similarity) (1831) ;mRNA; f:56977-63064